MPIRLNTDRDLNWRADIAEEATKLADKIDSDKPFDLNVAELEIIVVALRDFATENGY